MGRTAPTLLLLTFALGACSEPAAPPTPPVTSAPAARAVPPPPSARSAREEQLRKIVEHTKAYPWGENTGAASVRGRMTWARDGETEQPVVRRSLVLKGLKGTPTQGVYYNLRTDEQGEFRFERIRGGSYKLSDDVASGYHWRLRLDVDDHANVTMDLTPANSVAIRDDFPVTTR
jgi:hypothetical protein